MMYLPELKWLNDTFIHPTVPVQAMPKPAPTGVFILTIYQKGGLPAYKGKTGPIMYDPAAVNGWNEDELESAKAAAFDLQQMVGLDTLVAVDRRQTPDGKEGDRESSQPRKTLPTA